MLGITPGVLGFISSVVDLEVFGPRFWDPGSWILGPGVLGLRSRVLESEDPGSWDSGCWGPGSWFLILDYTLIILQRNLFTEVTGNSVPNCARNVCIKVSLKRAIQWRLVPSKILHQSINKFFGKYNK